MGDTLTFENLKPGQFFHSLRAEGSKTVYLKIKLTPLSRKRLAPKDRNGGFAVEVTGKWAGSVGGYFRAEDPVELVEAQFR